jgi:hypothetical protein
VNVARLEKIFPAAKKNLANIQDSLPASHAIDAYYLACASKIRAIWHI